MIQKSLHDTLFVMPDVIRHPAMFETMLEY